MTTTVKLTWRRQRPKYRLSRTACRNDWTTTRAVRFHQPHLYGETKSTHSCSVMQMNEEMNEWTNERTNERTKSGQKILTRRRADFSRGKGNVTSASSMGPMTLTMLALGTGLSHADLQLAWPNLKYVSSPVSKIEKRPNTYKL